MWSLDNYLLHLFQVNLASRLSKWSNFSILSLCYINFPKILERAWNYLYPLFEFSSHKLKWFYLLFHLTSLISLSNWPITWGGVVWGEKNKIEHESREIKNFCNSDPDSKKNMHFIPALALFHKCLHMV